MNPRLPMGLKTKLTLVMSLTSFCAVGLACVSFLIYDLISFREHLANDERAYARVVAENLTAAVSFNDGEAALQTLKALQTREDCVAAAVVDSTGNPLAEVQFTSKAFSFEAMSRPEGGFLTTDLNLIVWEDVRVDGRKVGEVRLASDLRNFNQRVVTFSLLTVLIMTVVGLVTFFVSRVVQVIVSGPIISLAQAARDVSERRDYSVRVERRSDDELGTLTDAFNRMLREIQSRDGQLEDQLNRLQLEVEERRKTEQALRSSEEQLRQAQKMEAVGQLAGGVAHDFNNLLTAILGYASLALAHVKEKEPVHEALAEIRRAGERAASLTRQLLAFSRKQVLETRILDVNEVVGNMQRMLQRVIGENISLVFDPDESARTIRVDPGQLEQVILNLCVNARDAMSGGGALTIETQNVLLSDDYHGVHPEVPPGDYVLLAVSDTGAGIDPEILPHIFEPFFTTKDVGKGTGLGLSTVYGIIKQSGGHVFVYSEPGHGTSFKIYFPAADADSESCVVTELARIERGTETILLVEDEPQVRELTRMILEMSGYQVIEAAHGGDAILAVDTCKVHIDLMLTDVVMPHMNGRELYERLHPVVPDMAVVYMSGYTDGAIEQHGILEEGTNFIQKPFTPETLSGKLRQVLDRRRAA